MDKRRRIALIAVAAAAVAAAVILISMNFPLWREFSEKKDRVVFRMSVNDSSGEFYKYELSRNDILREVDHYNERFFLNVGPGSTDVWEFEIVGEGEFNVYWRKYTGGLPDERGDFFLTYAVSGGKCAKTFDSRESDK